jgi:metallo-beta-lactamase family protein
MNQGRHPLDFNQLITIDSHQDHLAVINYLDSVNKPAIIIAASGNSLDRCAARLLRS